MVTVRTAIAADRPLAGRAVMITGGSGGMGTAAVQALAAAGADLAIAARSRSALEDTARLARREAGPDGGVIITVPTDVTSTAQVEAAVDEVTDRLGGIDVLITMAGRLGPIGEPLWESDPDEWAQTLHADVLGTVHTCQAVVPRMLEQGTGRILVMSSPAALQPIARLGPYCVSKAAVAQLTAVLAAELEGTGVTAHSFQPGPTDTPIYRQVRQQLYPDLPPGPAVDRDPLDAGRLLVLLSVADLPLRNGSMIYWNAPWVLRGLRRLRSAPAILR